MVQLGKSSASYTESGLFKVVSFVIISLLLVSCGASRTTISRKSTPSATRSDIIDYGRKYLGKPYRYAGRGPNAFDCSGYTAFVFKEFGYKLDSGSAGQERQVPHITDRKKLQKGDLVFFEGRRKNGKVEHVGIVTETLPNGAFRFIHASTGNGVIITSSSDYYWASRYLHGGRVLEENESALSEQKRTVNRTDHRFTPAASKEVPGKIVVPVITTATENEITAIEPAQKSAAETVSASAKEKNREMAEEIVVLVQKDPSKNVPLKEKRGSEEKKNDTVYHINNAVILKNDSLELPEPMLVEEKETTPANHTVKMGETLYSISRRYNCTVDQLRSWNPQLGEMLKVGVLIRVSD